MIPAGIIDGGLEAFYYEGHVKVIRGGQVTDLTDSIDALTAFRTLLEGDAEAMAAIEGMGIDDPVEQITIFVRCRFGHFDVRADLTATGVSIPEYWHCPSRGNCQHEGVLCKLPAGLTRRELQVVAMVARGLTNKEVGGELGISTFTVIRHITHIERKLDAHSKLDIMRFAIENNIEA